MRIQIKEKIVDTALEDSIPESNVKIEEQIVYMNENVSRPPALVGSTYKVRTPLSDHALYITINDIVLNKGTEHECVRPFEIFINSKNMASFQWIVALTRLISAVFRKGGDVHFLGEELQSVFDPHGGYWKQKKFYNSLVAEIGEIISNHIEGISMLQPVEAVTEEFTDNKIFCYECNSKSVVFSEGCYNCLNCGDSKCG